MDSIIVIAVLYALWHVIRIIRESSNSKSEVSSETPKTREPSKPVTTYKPSTPPNNYSKPAPKPVEKKSPIRQNKPMPLILGIFKYLLNRMAFYLYELEAKRWMHEYDINFTDSIWVKIEP